ncbi:Eco57I restriction-modification methylase domain-containing protein [Aliarcobacter skirrowii]|uniref:Eco57I restriction-modification methylase domain-containing protein n=1 Tax=Aliarcobacter skirrowii TaxID=28200 RepID=UPI0029BE79D5|nr:N-6 DNA methylase [Aliarcobacter skirrowii]MDX4035938.1 Eco57I restriction-modification methylase domain-containing protein [Aliarcobacter skirrowii]
MSIFQNSVLKTFKQDEKLVAARWTAFQNYKSKVEAIKDFKEEEYQDGFLKDIFESCLGYTLKTTNPSSFNLEREKKNETDSKKADGVIYLNSEIIAVIELKDTKTKNLDRVQQQAFWYLTQHTKAKYVIISNFDELRFYFDKSTAYESFSLFNLSYDEFCKLHLLLSFENIKDETALKIKEKSNSFEQDISKKLYKDFSHFRTLLFENIVKNNPTIDKQTLLRLTQKLCDRIIFILFAEDRDLLRANMIKEIREEFINQKFTNYSLYDIYKFYFEAINKGNDKLQIPQYNGGLFATDLLLDSLIIDDFILDENVQILSNYDFASEISVNILGHIFEQSLTDLEELQANIDNVNFDKTKSKRKKDGVFYTPEYITRYIVENTLGKMCSEKREELKIVEITPPSNPKKLTKQEQQIKNNLQEYKKWLLNLKILDPACGSGAFLNQALECLISEHKNLQNDLALMGDLFASYMVEEEILEHNLYGVDINEDAVEIAKLSLWLRTAKRGRALTKLADKIVCANSLLNMPFSENSFDVVIGNPPYVRQEAIKEQKEALSKIYKVYHGSADLYVYFVELGLKLLKNNGLFSYIFPNKWLKTSYGKPLRQFLKTYNIQSIIDFGDLQIFEGATTYPLILTISNSNQNEYFKSYQLKEINEDLNNIIGVNGKNFLFKELDDNGWNIFETNLLQKLYDNSIILDIYTNGNINRGIMTGFNDAFVIDEKTKIELLNEDNNSEKIIKPFLIGKDIQRYKNSKIDKWLLYIPWDIKIDEYPAIYKYLEKFKTNLENRPEVKQGRYPWYALSRYGSKYVDDFEKSKIIYLVFQVSPAFTMNKNNAYCNNATFIFPKEDYFLLGILNSKLGWFLISNICTKIQGGYQLIYDYFKKIPIKLYSDDKKDYFEKRVKEIFIINEKLQETKQNFINELNLEKVPTKLQKFEELDFDDFVKEYAKAKKLKFADKLEERNFKNEWQRLFENDKKEVLEIQNQINITDKEIDQMVYKLYDLTPDEIKIVEGA